MMENTQQITQQHFALCRHLMCQRGAVTIERNQSSVSLETLIIIATGEFVSDVDECTENSTICENGKFCDNTPGSHVCRGEYMLLFCFVLIFFFGGGGGGGFGLNYDLQKWFICLLSGIFCAF